MQRACHIKQHIFMESCYMKPQTYIHINAHTHTHIYKIKKRTHPKCNPNKILRERESEKRMNQG